MNDMAPIRSIPVRNFERKVLGSKLALVFERLWPRLWLVLGVVGVFILVSLGGLWTWLGPLPHKLALGAFAIALLAALILAFRVRWPSREEAIRRIERVSRAPHRPASSYEDTLSNPGGDPATRALWEAHRARIARMLEKLRVGTPEPRTDRHDPLALRALLLLGCALLTVFAGDSAKDRIRAAFRLGPPVTAAEARLDAWVTPPAYTARPPVMLADGARGGLLVTPQDGKPIEVPERSVLIVRTSGASHGQLGLDVKTQDGRSERLEAPAQKAADDAAELRYEIRKSGTIRALSGGSQLASWTFQAIPDLPPKIVMTKDPGRSPRGSMKLTYKIEDDYGVASAEAKFEKAKPRAGDPATAWARPDILKGPRPPLDRPPQMPLRLPRKSVKDGEAQTYLELGAHPWAGLRVIMTLQAKDHAGQIGKTQAVEMVLPARQFRKPLARAIVEQRRKLVEDARYRPLVAKALEALTLEPDGFITDKQGYLGLRTAYYRLQRDKSRTGIKSVIDQLWHVALRLEDGNLSEAERRLREAQEKLSKALEEGASDQEIQQLMNELRQALAQYMEQLARQAENMPPMQMPPGMDPSQMLSQEDLERMMRNIEDMAKNGSRDMAQQMLSELRDLLERLQSGRMAQGQQGQQGQQQMMQMMDELGNIIGNEQRLMDETFGEQRRQSEQEGQQGQRGQRGERQGRQGQQGQRGQQGQQGQRGQQGQQGEQGEGQQPGQQGRPGLGQRQGELRDRLGRLQQGLREFGMRSPEQFGNAEDAMRNAERALEQGDLDQATREQGRALEQLRQGAQSMAQQMLQQMPSRYGQAGDAPRDPLGRPQRSESYDPGTSVKVPDEIDGQRAREILEELRRRLGEPSRPNLELDYIERLLRRF